MAENHKNIHTSQKQIAQMIADMGLLVYPSNGGYKPLLVSIITTYISIIANEDVKPDRAVKDTTRKAKK